MDKEGEKLKKAPKIVLEHFHILTEIVARWINILYQIFNWEQICLCTSSTSGILQVIYTPIINYGKNREFSSDVKSIMFLRNENIWATPGWKQRLGCKSDEIISSLEQCRTAISFGESNSREIQRSAVHFSSLFLFSWGFQKGKSDKAMHLGRQCQYEELV